MNNQGAIQCKVKLLADGEQQEMRRFQLDDASFASSFDLFKEKLRAVFPQLRDTAFKVTWTDTDGDVITIGNDEDLLMSMMEMNGLKVLDVHINTDAKEELEEEVPLNMFSSVITCDVCNSRITRYRYKCLQCHDYDLCQSCEHAGNHSHHAMMRLVNLEIPRGLHKMVGHCSRVARKAAHHAAKEAAHAARGAHRAARCGLDMAKGVARSNSARCPFRQEERKTSATPQTQEAPLFDTGVLYDLASSFLGPFAQAATANNGPGQGQAQTQPQAQTPNQGATPTQAPGTGAATPTGQTPTANPSQAAPVDVIGNILRDVFSAINANVAQAASGPATPTPTAAPATTTTATTAARDDDVVIVDPVPTKAGPTSFIPMEVEQSAQPTKTASIYPNVPQGPDAGWTFVAPPPAQVDPQPSVPATSQPSAPAAFTAPLNPDEVKYASQLGQLRRMGFSDNIDLLGLLKRYNGNIGQVVNHLFEQGN